jgi:polyisoprenoid-binding protein YceI
MPPGIYELDKAHASITWKISHMGLSNYTARFTDFDAYIILDSNDLTQSSLLATIYPTSLKTDYPYKEEKDFDAKLSNDKDWFNASKFPKIDFESTKIKTKGKKKGSIEGNLTLLGITKPLTLDVTFNGAYLKKPLSNQPALGFSATTTLKRSDFGFDIYIPMIGDEVEILIEAEFSKIDTDVAE